MGSLQLGGNRFVSYSNDHPPRHLHGFFNEAEVIINLLADGNVALANRKDAIRPFSAKRADVKKILTAAAQNFEALVALWGGNSWQRIR